MNVALKRSINFGLWALFRQPISRKSVQAVFASVERLPALKKTRRTFVQSLFPLFILILIGTASSIPAYARESVTDDLITLAAQPNADSKEAVPVEFMNRPIFTIRSEFMGYTQEERAMSITNRIKSAMEKGGDDHVSIRHSPEGGRFVELNSVAVFQIRPSDIDPTMGESLDEVANNAAQNLKIAVSEAREQKNPKVMLKGIGLFVLASLFFYLACRFIYWGKAG